MSSIEHLSAFTGGLVSVLTPCVYPMIPITIAIFGHDAQAESSSSNQPNTGSFRSQKTKALLNALAYSFGILVTFTLMGFIVTQTGAIFGSIQSNPIVITLYTIFLIFLLFFSLDLYYPKFLNKIRAPESKSKFGVIASFFAGIGTTIVTAPCVGPILALILTYASTQQNTLNSVLLLASYGLGFSLPFLVLTYFSPLLKKLPKSGNWLYISKTLISFSIAAYIFYLISPKLHLDPQRIVLKIGLTLTIMFLALFLFSTLWAFVKNDKISRLVGSVAAGFLFIGLILTPNQATQASASDLVWLNSFEKGADTAKQENKLLFVDFYADWCPSCIEFDKLTFSDARVRKAMNEKLILVRIDLTDSSESEKLARQLKVIGLPSLLTFDSTGKEVTGSRIEGFLNADEFLSKLSTVKQ